MKVIALKTKSNTKKKTPEPIDTLDMAAGLAMWLIENATTIEAVEIMYQALIMVKDISGFDFKTQNKVNFLAHELSL